MKHVVILIILLFCAAVALVAVQNAEVLSPAPPMVVHWPGLLSIDFSLPVFALILILFAAGFVLTSLAYLGEHFRLKRAVAEVRREVAGRERELRPEFGLESDPKFAPEPEQESEPQPHVGFKAESDTPPEAAEPDYPKDPSTTCRQRAVAAETHFKEPSSQTLQIPTESTMEKKPSTPEMKEQLVSENDDRDAAKDDDSKMSSTFSEDLQVPGAPQAADASAATRKFNEDEVLERPSAPGWGAVIFLSAALALVVSSGVYIVLNSQMTQMSQQLGDLHMQSGHMASTQEEMGRIWERERVAVRDELKNLGQGQDRLGTGIETLEEQMLALQALPEIFRKRLVAGFLHDTAGKTAFLSTQVETDEQRETLEQVEKMLKSLATELENAGEDR